MPSKRETAVAALATLLLDTGATVWRGTDLERDIPPTGLIEVVEGEATETPLMSPLGFDVEQPVDVLVAYSAADEHARDSGLDALLASIHALVVADRTLSGTVDDIQIASPSFAAIETDGAGKVARIPVTLSFYIAGSPIG